MSVPTIMQSLRERTREHHQRIETVMDIMSPELSRARYVAILRQTLRLYRVLEPQLERIFSQVAPDFRYGERLKTPLIVRDLQALGELDAAADADPPPIAITNLDQALGCLYVIEGSTLGAQLITRHVEKLLKIDPENGGSFYHGYGPLTGMQWQWLRKFITARAEDENQVVAAAMATFEALMK